MNFKDIINTKLYKNSIFYANNKELSHYNFEFSSEDDINEKKSKDENYIINLDTELKTSNKEDRNIISNFIGNEFKITNFNFFIYNHHKVKNSNDINEAKNKDNEKLNNKERKERGRKKNKDLINVNGDGTEKEKITHNKYSDDNMRKKCKNIILKYAFKFINAKIKEIYKGNVGAGRLKKQLKVLKQNNKIKSTVETDKIFLEKSLKDIFSEDISNRFNNFSPNHNKKMIESLINDKDEEKKNYFNSLFNLKFLNCLNFFVGKEFIKELDGFAAFESIKDSIFKKHGKGYVELLEYYLNNFSEIINKKKARKKIKNKKKYED